MSEGRPDGERVVVAVVDSGWAREIDHPRVWPSLQLRADHGTLVGLEPAQETDRIGHGTMCARMVLAQSPDIVALPVRVFDVMLRCSPRELIGALDGLVRVCPEVVNLSLCTQEPSAMEALYVACEALNAAGTVVVAAAQNGGLGGMPAEFENVIGVGLRPLQEGQRLAVSEDSALDLVVASGLSVRVDGHPAHRVTTTSAATAVVSGLVAAWIAERGRGSAQTVRASLLEETAWWDAALTARQPAAV